MDRPKTTPRLHCESLNPSGIARPKKEEDAGLAGSVAGARNRPVEPLRKPLPARFRSLAPPPALRARGLIQEQARSGG